MLMNRKNKNRLRRLVAGFLPVCLCAFLPFVAEAQTVKNIDVSGSEGYTDHVALSNDATDKDLMVKFVFNEAKNSLTVTLISYRHLLVFWQDTRYKSVVSCWRHRLKVDHLPFPVTTGPADMFHLTKNYRKSLPKPYSKYIFRKWIAYDGLQPVEKEHQLVNDQIEQEFTIQEKLTQVTVQLRDILMMTLKEEKGVARYYDIDFGRDANITYQVNIHRDPCTGMEEATKASEKTLEAIRKSYYSLLKRYKKAVSNEELALFKEMKATVLAQYPKDTDSVACPAIQLNHETYNQYVDSIANLKVKVVAPVTSDVLSASPKAVALNTKALLSNARQIDRNVSQWLVSRDETERADLKRQTQDIINDTKVIIRAGSALTAEEQKAVNIFRQAVQYFDKICK